MSFRHVVAMTSSMRHDGVTQAKEERKAKRAEERQRRWAEAEERAARRKEEAEKQKEYGDFDEVIDLDALEDDDEEL